jgi:ubiquinone/menaquinone biosynthesis C-methylase UbiE
LLERIAERYPHSELTGVDPSAPMIAVARSKGLRARFAIAAAESLPFADASFDAVVTTISMHHWVDPAAGLRELARVLRPGGRAVIVDMQRGGFYRLLRPLFPSLWRDHAYRPKELSGMLKQAGFADVRQRVPRRFGRALLVSVGVTA